MAARAVRLSKFPFRFRFGSVFKIAVNFGSISVRFRLTEPGPKPNQFRLTEPDSVNRNWYRYIVPPLVLAYSQLASNFCEFYVPNINNLT